MKVLYILRHAKSSWKDSRLSDFDRPLNGRGREAAPLMGALMKRLGYMPDVIVSSPAVRARETALAVKAASGTAAPIVYKDAIYEASPLALAQIIGEIGNEYASALLVGHNPGFEGFLTQLTGRVEPMPTACLAAIHLHIERWSEADKGGKLVAIHRPKGEVT